MTFRNLETNDLQKLFCNAAPKTYQNLEKILAQEPITYRSPTKIERDKIIVEILSSLFGGQLSKVGMPTDETLSTRRQIWSDVWEETFHKYVHSNYDESVLNPSFIGSRNVFRFQGDFIITSTDNIEFILYKLVREWMVSEYLDGVGEVWEFGCGSGFNVAHLAKRLPSAKFVGLDWAVGSNNILNNMGDQTGRAISGQNVDLFSPKQCYPLNDAVAYTFCALEQLGPNHSNFLESMIASKPLFCIHMEPIVENYDRQNLVDELAYQYHVKRGYLDGFKTKLKQYEEDGRLQIIVDHRMGVGSFFHEGFSLLVWTAN